MMLSLVLVLLAIAIFRSIRSFRDDVPQLMVLLTSTFLLITAIATAPWTVQLIVLITLVSMLRKLQPQT
jgi:hypothetical protein